MVRGVPGRREGQVEAVETHEIIYKSQGGKCVPDNEIAVCRPDHQRTHFLIEPYLHREELYKIKKGEVDEDNLEDAVSVKR